MRCEQCGRWMKSAELWRLANDPNAPTSHSMRQMCWDCRLNGGRAERPTSATLASRRTESQPGQLDILAEALAIVSAYEATLDADPSF